MLNAGRAGATGNIAVISAGTGLGEAGMYWDGAQHHPFAGEGGHADFAPHADLEVELLRYLRGKLGGHVSWERVVSGPGLASIYEFLRDTGRGIEPDWLAEAHPRRRPARPSISRGRARGQERSLREGARPVRDGRTATRPATSPSS